MNTTKFQIAVSSTSPNEGFTPQQTQISLGVIVSVVMLLGVGASIVTKINKISFTVDGIQDALKLYATNAEKIKELDKRLDIHLQDYINYKDANLLSHNGLKDLIEHKWQRSESEFDEIKQNIKELQNFLHQTNNFKIRE